MKKFLCILLAVLMVLSLGGCFGDPADADVRGDITGNTTNPSQTQNEPEFSLGKAANNTYTNDFLGISCTLSDQWVFYTDEEILALNNIVGDYVDEEVAEQIKKATIIYDMYATVPETGDSININLEKLNAVQLISLDIKKTLESQISVIQTAYQNMGYTDTQVVYQKVSVDGKEFDALKITATIQGIDFYGTCFTFRKGSYLSTVTICSLLTDNFDTLAGCFTVK